MHKDGKDLLKLLFNEGETVCVSNNEFGFHSIPLEKALDGEIELISPNETATITYCDSSKLTMVAINPISGWRRDECSTAFRSFLIELDVGSIKEQMGYISHMKVPFSAQIFSGGKSVHTVITLDEDIPDEKTYRALCVWIFNILTLADDKCKNPSRSTRIPGASREPGKKQRLIKMKKRVSHKELMGWLNKYEHLRPKVNERRKVAAGEADFDRLSPWARGMLKKGIDFKNGRNQTWYALAMDFALAGFTEEQAIEKLGLKFTEEYDFKEKEWLTTVASAFKHVDENK